MRIPDPSLPTLIALLATLVVVAIVDLRTRTIPNWRVGAIAATGLLHAGLAGGPESLLPSLGGGLAGGAFLLLQWRYGLVGGGDLKLLAALGVWLGVLRTFYVLLFGSVLGGVLSVAALVRLSSEERSLAGGAIYISNGNNLSDDTIDDINQIVAAHPEGVFVAIPVVASHLTPAACTGFQFNRQQQIVGYVMLRLVGASKGPPKVIETSVDCTHTNPAPPGGPIFGLVSVNPHLVK